MTEDAQTKITALVMVASIDAGLERTLEGLRIFDSVLVADATGSVEVARVAREYGATLVPLAATDGSVAGAQASDDWVLWLVAGETLSESLEVSLLEFRQRKHTGQKGFRIPQREQNGEVWTTGEARLRLVPSGGIAGLSDQTKDLPGADGLLEGEILRFAE